MTIAEVSHRTQAHIRYKNKNGKVVPGATTIIVLLNKPQLIIWANRLGLQGIDSTKYRDDKADIGTLAHAMVLAELKGIKVDTSEYSEEQIEQAENSYLSWLEWSKGKDIKSILLETPLVSEQYQFGGMPDFLGQLDGTLVLMDYKTGGIYKEVVVQMGAYVKLLEENKYPPCSDAIVLGIPRSEDESFREVKIGKGALKSGWEVFSHLRATYDLLKLLDKAVGL